MLLRSYVGVRAPLAVALMLIATASSHANPLLNPGFEAGNFIGWTVGGTNGGSGVASSGTVIPGTNASFGTVTVLAHSGNYAAFGVVAESLGESLKLSQTVNLTSGNYDVGYFMGNDSSSGFGVRGAIVDGLLGIVVNGVPLTISFNPTLQSNLFRITGSPNEMVEVFSEFSSAGGSTTIEFDISGSGTARAGISVDDFFVNPAAVPEPNTLALFGIAVSCLMFLRPRRSPELDISPESRVDLARRARRQYVRLQLKGTRYSDYR
jgi:hypothetical protein